MYFANNSKSVLKLTSLYNSQIHSHRLSSHQDN